MIALDTIQHGDCLDLLPSIPTASVDMILCDLPYGTTRNPWDSTIDLEALWPEYLRIAKPNAAIVLTAQQPFTSALVMSQPKLFRYEWIWEKPTATGHLNAKRMPMKAHESVLVFYRSLPIYNPEMTHGHERKTATRINFSTNYGEQKLHDSYDSTDRYPRSVQVFSTDRQKSKLHPTQKPVALFEYLIRTYTNEGDVVLDNAIGSGTTAVAARNTGRHFIGMEMDDTYFQTATQRLAA